MTDFKWYELLGISILISFPAWAMFSNTWIGYVVAYLWVLLGWAIAIDNSQEKRELKAKGEKMNRMKQKFLKEIKATLDKEMNIHANKVWLWIESNFKTTKKQEKDYKEQFLLETK